MPESMGIALIFLLIFLIVMTGILLMKENNDKNDIVGVLRIETSDPDGPYMFLELYTSISELMKREDVRLHVDTTNYISR